MAAIPRPTVPQLTNGHLVTAPPKGVVGGNRKKQKRRAKQAAKTATQPVTTITQDADIDYDEDPLGYNDDEEDYYSDADNQHFQEHYPSTHAINGYDVPLPAKKNNRRKKKRAGVHDTFDGDALPELPNPPTMVVTRGSQKQNIWNTSTQQERQNIKNFWLSLSEDERKSLLKIEKEAVLRKMKQQQKHSCSCTVCGRKRTAIEEELEVLYEGYYEELEQYAHHDNPPLPPSDIMLPAPLSHRPHPLAAPPPPPPQSQHRASQLMEHLDDEEEYSDGDEEYSDEEYSEEEPEPTRGPIADFFSFGQNLTVKDNLLTVADDLLKNDGRKFIEMMEQLAERRMQRENEAEYAAANPRHPGGGSYHPDGNYNDNLDPNDDYDDDDEASYDSQEEYDDELEDEDEMSGLTEEQRMQEGRRMFQIFAARMFEHRVLTAYKEKVAAERQQKLLEELQDEEQQEAQREAKKKRDAEKKKDKKRQQQLAKAEEKAKKEAEKAAEESRLREAEEKKQEEQRRKKEELRKRKEDEKRKLEEDRLKKEADRLRRQQEEQQRREEAERKLRETKAAEKARKEEVKKREKEEREAREKALRERKAQQDEADRRDREAKLKSEPQVVKRPSHSNMVALPKAMASPKPAVATPAIPKVSTGRQTSHGSSPKQVSNVPSKSSSPGNVLPQHPPGMPKTILQKPPSQPVQHIPQHMPPPPGMHPNGFQQMPYPPGPMPMRSPMPMYPGPPMPMPGRMAFNPSSVLPPGMARNFPFEATAPPPGFHANHTSPIGPGPSPQELRGPHSRQQSLNDKFDAAVGASVHRPAPIQRPTSVKPHSDVDDLSRHLGSSALLDDDDDDDVQQPIGRRISRGPLDSIGGFPASGFGAPSTSWSAPFSTSPGLGHQWGNTAPAANWNSSSFASNSGFGSISGTAGLHRPSLHGSNRPLTIRIAVCQACKQLSAALHTADGFHDVSVLLHQIDHNRPPLDFAPTLKEIEDICETEGDAQNGGGELQVRKLSNGVVQAVRWQPDALTPDIGRQNTHGSLGEIGSPLPSKSTPAIGFGAPGMGRSGTGAIGGWAL